jgi:hypothetical protein
MAARLVSVNVGMPKDVPWRGKTALPLNACGIDA